MKKVYIFPNLTEERYIEKVKKAIGSLERKGYICILNKDDGTVLYGNEFEAQGDISDCSLIVSLGGDGTFLRGCQVALNNDLPICGINCGNLGYLCACQLKEIDDLDLDKLKQKELYILQFEYESNTFTALNEVVIGKDYFGGTIEVEYECDESRKRFKGDGLIVCTATGSTAYNVSAGGKAFKEEDGLIGITPICPYTRDVKAIRVDQRNRVKIRLVDKKYSASIFADGRLIGKLDEITVRLSERKIKVLNNK
ncbi:MAG: NAD(+)/NADH kinase [Erysipelotrichaceae bacterium]|nr:NAD(+)/NADH kinase [Erysipelotrichaceae bacterium]